MHNLHRFFMRCIFVVALSLSPASHAQSPIHNYMTNENIVGEGRFRHYIWDVYDARLYAPGGEWVANNPFALELTYLMSLKGKAIADQSIKEMRKQGFTDEIKLATWHNQMRSIFPDVSTGEVITGIFTEDGTSVFYFGLKEIGRIQDPEFSKVFFDIWLGSKTSEPELRKKLLGLEL